MAFLHVELLMFALFRQLLDELDGVMRHILLLGVFALGVIEINHAVHFEGVDVF